MSVFSYYLLRTGIAFGRPLIVTVAYLPILLAAVGLLPALLLGFTFAPRRYADSVLKALGLLQAWGCAVITATNGIPLGQPLPADPTPSAAASAPAEARGGNAAQHY